MGDGSYRLSAAVCAMPASDADKLIAAGSGDCALLYIYLLRCGPAPDEELCRALGMDAGRLAAAAGKLRSLGLLATGAQRLPPAQELPQYTSEEVVRRTGEDPAFRGVLSEAERLLGHTLSGADTRTLFGIYDFLGLPVDVMMLLMHHCAEECRLKYGPGRVPTVRQIEKEAYVWANREIMTFEQAEEYIRARARMREAAEEVKRALGISGRDFTPTERKYVESWLSLGFGPEADGYEHRPAQVELHEQDRPQLAGEGPAQPGGDRKGRRSAPRGRGKAARSQAGRRPRTHEEDIRQGPPGLKEGRRQAWTTTENCWPGRALAWPSSGSATPPSSGGAWSWPACPACAAWTGSCGCR